MIEDQLNTHLVPRWEEENYVFTGYSPIQLEWKQFQEAGRRATSIYENSAPVTYAGETGTVTVAHGGVGSWDEVRVFYVDGNYQDGPEPSLVEFGPNNIRITFPKERLVRPSLMMTGVYERNMQYQPVDWADNSNFCQALTVAREYTDTTNQACLRLRQSCTTACTWTTQSACVRVEDAELGWVNVHPATYRNGAWAYARYTYFPEQAFVYYQSGLTSLPAGMFDAVVRLAHTLMPNDPCPSGAEPLSNHWERDRSLTTSMTRERQNCPWGAFEGAWYAWNYVTNLPWYIGRGGGWMGAQKRRNRREWERYRLF
jgi:hypothetical protein